MGSQIFESSLPLEIQQQIDACCQAFEDVWKVGDTPKLEEYLTRVPQIGHAQLLRELLILELNYRRDDQSAPLSDSQVCALHPALMPDIAEQLKVLGDRRSGESNGDAVTKQLRATVKDDGRTIDHQPKSSGSRELHIRCPHCSNPVELLSDTPLESITCRTCGSTFSLVGQEEITREAPTLKRIGRFELIARLGIGGFGTVWKARDTELDRTVAVKIPRKGQLGRDEVEQFLREARSAAQLRHPNIVQVHEVGRDGDTFFIVSDLVRGVSLGDWLSGATPSAQEIAELLATLADALHHAHQKGVVHRDLKPSNILLDDVGQPHVMDFGLAKREIGEITMTIDGHVLGTPAYMSPEQAAGHGHWTDRRTDIYSLGVILFRMLTGELPFRGNTQMQIHQRLTEDPPDPRKLNRHLPRDLGIICLKCMERDPNRRYATAKDLADELRRFVRQEPILSRPVSRTERVLRWAKRNPALATAIMLTVSLAIAGPVAAVVFKHQQTRIRAQLVENDNLIDRYRNDIQSAEGQIDDLRDRLDVWEGKANPWGFWLWPPKRDAPPRRTMAAEIRDHSNTTLVNALRDQKYGNEVSARGYLGLGILADVVGESSDARQYYQLARDQLLTLRQQNPDEPRLARGLAQCYMQLARLAHDADPDSAAKDLQRARAIYEQLAAEHKSDAIYQIDWLETELTSAIGQGAVAGERHLNRVKEINEKLKDKWPTDPNALYGLACYLTDNEPILAPAAKPAEPAAPDSSPPKD